MSLPAPSGTEVRRRPRGRMWKVAVGLNVVLSLLLAAAAVGMLNYLVARHLRAHWDISRRRFYGLSEKTRRLLADLRDDVTVSVVFRATSPEREDLVRDVMNLLEEYRLAVEAGGRCRFLVQRVDPVRDLGKVAALRRRSDLRTTDVVVVEAKGRSRCLTDLNLVEYDYVLSAQEGMTARKVRKAFLGEQAISSALFSLTQERPKVVAFLKGHGEHDIGDFAANTGYSTIARSLEAENMVVRPLTLSGDSAIPSDVDLLVVAGPVRSLHRGEIAELRAYLQSSRSLLLLLDAGRESGLEPLLEEWGLRLPNERVVERTLILSMGANGVVSVPGGSDELYVRKYGVHPITVSLKGMTAVLTVPRPVLPVEAPAAAGSGDDRPRISLLAACTENGWSETDWNQEPPKYDAGVDRRGPIPVAAAVEKGVVSGAKVEWKPTRLVVFGDSGFACNSRLAGANEDLFLNAANWLIERETLLAAGPKAYERTPFRMDGRQVVWVFVILVVGLPGCAAALGVAVWLRRMR